MFTSQEQYNAVMAQRSVDHERRQRAAEVARRRAAVERALAETLRAGARQHPDVLAVLPAFRDCDRLAAKVADLVL
jgi:hypothetical protein